MNKNRMLVDMHLHTTASDGSFSPSEVVQRVKSSGVKVFSLTDHDTTAGVHEVEDDIPKGMEFFKGIEFSCKAGDIKCHILGYSYDDNHPDFMKALAAAEAKREDKLAIRIEHLREVDGIELTADEIAELEAIPSDWKSHNPETDPIVISKSPSDSSPYFTPAFTTLSVSFPTVTQFPPALLI